MVIEDIAFRIDALESSFNHIVKGFPCNLIDLFSSSRSCSRQDETVDQIRLDSDDFLGNHTPHRKAKEIDLIVTKGLYKVNCLLSHSRNGWRHFALTGSDTRKVDHNHMVFFSNQVQEFWIPVVEGCCQMDQH